MERKERIKTVVRSIRLPERVWNAISKLADEELRSAQMQLRRILEDWLTEKGHLTKEEE